MPDAISNVIGNHEYGFFSAFGMAKNILLVFSVVVLFVHIEVAWVTNSLPFTEFMNPVDVSSTDVNLNASVKFCSLI